MITEKDNLAKFFIIGAPKCGTTSLSEWISNHPKVYMSPIKEPHYFSDDLEYRKVSEKSEYERLFEGSKNTHEAVGEGSVFYLFSDRAIPNIERCITDPHYFVMVRNPVEMARSLHEQQLVAGNEHIEDFETAFEMSEDRLRGKKTSYWCREPRLLAYKNLCRLGTQVNWLFDLVPQERVHVIVLDDLKTDSLEQYRDTLQFLSLDYDGRTEFPAHNTAKERKSQILRRIVKGVNALKRSLGVGPAGTGFMDWIDKANTQNRPRPPLPSQTRQKVAEYFKEDVHLLSKTLDRDLTHWVKT